MHVNAYEGPTPTHTSSMSLQASAPGGSMASQNSPGEAPDSTIRVLTAETGTVMSPSSAVHLMGSLAVSSYPNPMSKMCILRLVRMWTQRETEGEAHFMLSNARGMIVEM